MRDKDLINLEEAYQTVQEGKFKSLAAAAALGLGNLAHGQMTPDDYTDKANPREVSPTPQPSPEEGETAWHKAKVAFDKATGQGGRNVDQETLKAIAGYQDTAEQYGLYLAQRGLPIPQIIKMASPEYAKRLGNFLNSNTRN
jgi:hypothetical protein